MSELVLSLFMLSAPMYPAECSLPVNELRILCLVADHYGLQGEERALLFVIREVEAGRSGREMGVLSNKNAQIFEDGFKSLFLQADYAARTIKKRYKGDLKAFANRYAPTGAPNDPNNLNQYWYPRALYLMKKYGYFQEEVPRYSWMIWRLLLL